MRPVYDDGRLAVTERYSANGSDLIVVLPNVEADPRDAAELPALDASKHVLDARSAEELRDGLSEWLARHGR
jgi:hypothetical protein